MSKERLDALAAVIEKASDSFARNQTDQTFWSQRVKIQAEYFRVAVPLWTTNPIAHRVEYERVDGLHESDLRPRKAGFTIPGTEQEPDFNGLFAVRRTAADGGQDRVDLLLMRMGNEVTGGYSNGKVDGFIEGEIKDGVLQFTWRRGDVNGHGVAESQGETLRGSWGIGEAKKGAGEFIGVRQRKDKTSP